MSNETVVVPFVEKKSDESESLRGFYVTLPDENFPLMTMDSKHGLNAARYLWESMGFEVSEIMHQNEEEWVAELLDTGWLLGDTYTDFNEAIDKLSDDAKTLIETMRGGDWYCEDDRIVVENIDTETNISGISESDVNAELNGIFCKVSVPFEELDEITLYDQRRENFIGKNELQFLATKDEVKAITKFYNGNCIVDEVDVHYLINHTIYRSLF